MKPLAFGAVCQGGLAACKYRLPPATCVRSPGWQSRSRGASCRPPPRPLTGSGIRPRASEKLVISTRSPYRGGTDQRCPAQPRREGDRQCGVTRADVLPTGAQTRRAPDGSGACLCPAWHGGGIRLASETPQKPIKAALQAVPSVPRHSAKRSCLQCSLPPPVREVVQTSLSSPTQNSFPPGLSLSPAQAGLLACPSSLRPQGTSLRPQGTSLCPQGTSPVPLSSCTFSSVHRAPFSATPGLSVECHSSWARLICGSWTRTGP